MSKKAKILIILFILIVAIPITTVIAASKQGTWNGKNLKSNTNNWNGQAFASSNTTAAIYKAMNDAKNKTGSDRFSWINSKPRDQFRAIWRLGADIYKEGVSCIGHRLAGWDGLCSIQVFDMYENTTDWKWQELARLIADSVGKGEDSVQERRVVQWCYDHSKEFAILRQDKRDQSGSWGASYKFAEQDAKKMAVNEFESTSTKNGKQEVNEKDGYTFIGPYNLKIMGGEISEITITTSEGTTIKAGPNDNKIFVSIDGKTLKKMNDIKAQNLGYTNYKGNNFYIVYKGNLNGVKQIKITRKKSGYRSRLVVVEALGVNGQNLILFDGAPSSESTELLLPEAKPNKGNLKVIKVDQNNNEVKLANVGFIIKNKNTGKYVQQTGTGKNKIISYVEKDNATEFVTDANGEIYIEDLVVGTYIAYETKNPNHGYKIVEDGMEKEVIIDKTQELKIPNKQEFVNVSGYVWVDKGSSKKDVRNELYKTDEHPEVPDYKDDKDIPKEGITVRLKNKSTNETVQETKTDKDGKYQFMDVLVDDLGIYYIEFEYDGFTYTNVTPNLSKDTGSKSKENESDRDANINNKFAKVENNKIIDTNNNLRTVSYTDNKNHTSKFNLNTNGIDYPITSTTKEAGYYLDKQYTPGKGEIQNINLGLYERSMPDIALMKDLTNVKVAINGKEHIYQYAQRFLNAGEYGGEGFNIGVKFGEKYGSMSYSRPIYKADYEYETSNKSNELEVYITYDIRVRNQSNLKINVNSIVDYYDSRYELVKIGTGLTDGNITGNEIGRTDLEQYGNYKKTIINSNLEIDSGKDKDVYVQFRLDRNAVLNILNSKENLNNVAEINSYTTYKDNELYAGIDVDSNPGSAIPGNKSTYEDDTDEAPGLLLEPADAREIAGKVFLDSTSGELMTGEIRQGSGAFEEEEKGIPGVKVSLKEISGSGKEYTVDSTDSNGDFTISGFIPGDYTLTYTWGDETYTVQDYKATVWVNDNVKEKQNNGDKWYKNQTIDNKTGKLIRFSDALDEYSVSQSRDEITTMNSTTPKMDIGVEYETTYTASTGDKYTYRIENIDFGIVERARQSLKTEKRIKTFKVISSGQTIADAHVIYDENKKQYRLENKVKYVTYMSPALTTIPNNGFLKLELDDELMQGTTIEVTYEIKVTNESELDYLSDEYYKFGIQDPDKIVTITPSGIVDYLDSGYKFDENKNPQWKIKKFDEIKESLDNKVYEDEESTIANKIILYTESLKDKKLVPSKDKNDGEVLNINLSKELAISDEIVIDNETEIIKVAVDGDARLDIIPGNYIPGKAEQQRESDDAQAETIIITPSTGENLDFILPITIGIIALVILGTGVVLIKKKAL